MELLIDGYKIGNKSKAFIIAEAGVNHNGDLLLAKKLCEAAKDAGANAVKFQTWKTEYLITHDVKTPSYQKIATGNISQFSMLKKLELSFEDFTEISNYCNKIGIIFLATPGDEVSADFLDNLGVPAFKIGSDDLDNFLLLKYVAEKKKPMIISTGMSTMQEVKRSLKFVKKINKKIVILHCTSSYPTDLREVNMRCIMSMIKQLKIIIGYSDHTTNMWVPALAVCTGAKVIEKHLTLDKNMTGPDHKSSLTPIEFKQMVELIRKTEMGLQNKLFNLKCIHKFLSEFINDVSKYQVKLAMGSAQKKPTTSEKEIMPFVKKTIVAAMDIKKGERLSKANLTVKRAGKICLKPTSYFDLINKTVVKKIKKDEVIDYEKCT